MWLSMWEGTHQDGSTGESTKPCQSQIIRLGLNAIPNEMAVLYTLGNLPPRGTSVEYNYRDIFGLSRGSIQLAASGLGPVR